MRDGAARNPHRFEAPCTWKAHAIDKLVAPSVICASSFDNPFALGVCARQAYRTHHRLGARPQQAQHLDAGHRVADEFREFDFVLVQKAGNRSALPQQFFDLAAHQRVIRSQKRWSARLQEIDVTVSVHICQVSAVRLRHGNRKRVIERQVVLNAPRYHFLRRYVQVA